MGTPDPDGEGAILQKASWRSGPKLSGKMTRLDGSSHLLSTRLSLALFPGLNILTHLLIPSVIQQIFGCPLYAKHWRFSSEQKRQKRPAAWSLHSSEGQDDAGRGVGTGNKMEYLAYLTVLCAAEKLQSKESGSWGEGIPIIIHILNVWSLQNPSKLCWEPMLFFFFFFFGRAAGLAGS